MRFLTASAALLSLAACTPDAMLMTNPNAALDFMAGTGSVARSQSGQTTFRWVIPENAFSGLIAEPAQQREQDKQALAQWIGRQGICPSGYTVNPPINADGMLIYEGTCR